MYNGCSLAYAIKSCNKCHWGTVFINSEKENVGSLKNKPKMIRKRLCIKRTQFKARQPKLS